MMGFHPDWNEINAWIRRSSTIFVKKLSRNDVSWADSHEHGHQNGFFIPRPIAESGFFPELKNSNPAKPHVFDAEYQAIWPASGEMKRATIKHYSQRNPGNKEKARPRYEWQHTGIPREQFRNLSPASLLLVGKLGREISGALYWFMVIDSASEEAEIMETVLDLDSDFHSGLFDVASLSKSRPDPFPDEVIAAIGTGNLEEFIAGQTIPSPGNLARQAQNLWLEQNHCGNLDPFSIPEPGNAVMQISRDIEYALYKQAELRLRVAQVARILVRDGKDPITNLVRGFSEIDAIFLSAAQTRKSRAGLSFEHHVQRLFTDGRIRHEAQAVFGGRRPDFVLPDIETLNARGDVLIVSLKTTLRERWKQLALEKPFGAIFLATVDDRVSGEAIDEMEKNGISLVVPESLKKSDESVYRKHGNVITFRHFFDHEVKEKRPSLFLLQ